MNITIMAHDKKKELMVQFCTAYKSVLNIFRQLQKTDCVCNSSAGFTNTLCNFFLIKVAHLNKIIICSCFFNRI